MTSLYNRATPSQARILRAVEGAVKNVAHHHPDFNYTPRLARSIAKRAAGTLSAQWAGVLAAKPSEPTGGDICKPLRSNRSSKVSAPNGRWGASQTLWRSPFPELWSALVQLVGEAKKAGDKTRADALIDALRIVAAQQKIFEDGAR